MQVTLLYKIESLLHSFFIVFWGICLFSILAYLLFREKFNPNYKLLLVLAAGYIIANITISLSIDHHLKAKIMNIDPTTIDVLEFHSGAERAIIKKDEEIDIFIDCLKKSESFSSKHSEPLKRIYFCFNESDYYYSIARDSKLEYGFWLSDESCPNCENGRTIFRFKSKRMSTFLTALSPLFKEVRQKS